MAMRWTHVMVGAVLAWLLVVPAHAMSVAFINPGKSSEAYWATSAAAMGAAAQSLDVRFENHYAERAHPRAVGIARQLAARSPAQRPDYVIFSNDYGTGPEVLRILDAAGIKTFMAFSGVQSAQDRAQTGHPRERFKGWLGSLEPQAEDAGYLTARDLIAAGRRVGARAADGKLHLLAIGGDRSTPSSVERNAGMRRAVVEAGDVVIDQEVYAAWRLDKAAEQAAWLYGRYPDTRLVWSGSDQMAFGAMQAWTARGGVPGRTAWFSGINTSGEALEAIQDGRLAALAGGHFIAGAWAIVMLYDYHRGRDFAADEGLELRQPMFVAFTAATARAFAQRYGDGRFDRVDFQRYAKTRNRDLKRYDFRFTQLLE